MYQEKTFPKPLVALLNQWYNTDHSNKTYEECREALCKLIDNAEKVNPDRKKVNPLKGFFNKILSPLGKNKRFWKAAVDMWLKTEDPKQIMSLFELVKTQALPGIAQRLRQSENLQSSEDLRTVLRYLDNPLVQYIWFCYYAEGFLTKMEVPDFSIKRYMFRVLDNLLPEFDPFKTVRMEITPELLNELMLFGGLRFIRLELYLSTSYADTLGKGYEELYIRYGRPSESEITETPMHIRHAQWSAVGTQHKLAKQRILAQLARIKTAAGIREFGEPERVSEDQVLHWLKSSGFELRKMIVDELGAQEDNATWHILNYEPSWQHASKHSFVKLPGHPVRTQLRATARSIRNIAVYAKGNSEEETYLLKIAVYEYYHLMKGLYNLGKELIFTTR